MTYFEKKEFYFRTNYPLRIFSAIQISKKQLWLMLEVEFRIRSSFLNLLFEWYYQ